MSAVRTTTGTLVKKEVGQGDNVRTLTEDEAEALAKECNAKAAKLGIEASYEVTEK